MQLKTLFSFVVPLLGLQSSVHSLNIPPAQELHLRDEINAQGGQSNQLYKFEVGIYKRNNVTWDAFAAFLVNSRYPKVKPLVAKHGVAVWTETLTPPSARAIAAGAIPPGWTVPQYDSISTYYVSDPSVLGALTTDPAWIALEIAAAGYVDGSRGTLLAGFETVKYEKPKKGGKGKKRDCLLD
ncbi:hypothetical protein QC761_401625 [Podospora bellae-mahoneyi]|uniref:EthD domain-containing protein n=1 Tax=Podospora bellae-mahoneyi TaxID=2093777 RepID=A0ABR0FGJ3_9PEZI|nr:hypothetical protein QC761_401625 [Podospora bellae-mahoneyi]